MFPDSEGKTRHTEEELKKFSEFVMLLWKMDQRVNPELYEHSKRSPSSSHKA